MHRLVIAVSCLALTATAHAQLRGTLVYHTLNGPHDTTLHRMDLEQRTPVPIPTPGIPNPHNPRFSRDGVWLTFQGNRHIWVCRPEGAELRQVTSAEGDWVEPSFSPEGDRIVYHRVHGEIRVINFDGTGDCSTDVNGGHTRWQPRPGSTKIVFTNWPTMPSGLFVGSLVGCTLTFGPFIMPEPQSQAYNNAAWSPDGRHLAVGWRTSDGTYDILLVTEQGVIVRNLTNTPGVDEGVPAWSSDGRYIVFSRQSGSEKRDLFSMRLDGSELENITNTPDIDEHAPSLASSFNCESSVAYWALSYDVKESCGRAELDGSAVGDADIIPVNDAPAGAFTAALNLTGAPSRVNIPTEFHAPLPQGTVEAWVRLAPGSTDSTIFNHGIAAAHTDLAIGLSQPLTPGAPYRSQLWVNNGGSQPIEMPGFQTGQWHHMAWQWTGETHRYFLDGALFAEFPSTLSPLFTGDEAEIGSDDQELGYFQGQLAHLRISTRALAPAELASGFFGPCLADFNRDGDIGTDADIEAFFACLAGSCCRFCGTVDFNGDGDIGTDADIESFFRVLAGGPC